MSDRGAVPALQKYANPILAVRLERGEQLRLHRHLHRRDQDSRVVHDLYFFAQAEKGSEARKLLDAQADQIRADVQAMTTDSTRAAVGQNGCEVYGVRRSLVEVARTLDPSDATMAFFRECASSVQGSRSRSLYLGAIGSTSRPP